MSERRDADELREYADPATWDMMDRLAAIDADLAAIDSVREHLASLRKTVIRWVWESEGWTVREAAEVFGIPKSTLNRWASSEDWSAGLRDDYGKGNT